MSWSAQGRDAWNAVGGAAVEVATTLDIAVEHLLEGWTSPQAGKPRGAAAAAGAAGSQLGCSPERQSVSSFGGNHTLDRRRVQRAASLATFQYNR